MRRIISLSAFMPFLCASAQNDGAGSHMASVLPRDSAHAQTARWSGGSGAFQRSEPIQPIALRAITWEFGDGSSSNIFPPRPWRPSEGSTKAEANMAPFREHSGGSPCVAASGPGEGTDGTPEPRAHVISETGVQVLVTTGSDRLDLRVRTMDALGRDRSPILRQCFTSGRWKLDSHRDPQHALFILLEDIVTGERWRASTDL